MSQGGIYRGPGGEELHGDGRPVYRPPAMRIEPLTVRCPVPHCNAEPGRKCCDRRGITKSMAHIDRVRKANGLPVPPDAGA